MNQKTEVAAIGTDESILIFNAVGIRTFMTKSMTEADQIIFQLANQKFKIIYVSEGIYSNIPETILKYQSQTFPVIIPIPTKEGSQNVGLKKIQENVEKAIGINIF